MTGLTSHAEKIRQGKLNFMQRYMETVFLQVIQEEGMKVSFAPQVIKNLVHNTDYKPHAVWMDELPKDEKNSYMGVSIGYWSDRPIHPEVTGVKGFGHWKSSIEKSMEGPHERVAEKFRDKLKELGFQTKDYSYKIGTDKSISEEFPDGFPSVVTVLIKGTLSKLVSHAKTTEIGRDMGKPHAPGA
jgi:hypothetical protein